MAAPDPVRGAVGEVLDHPGRLRVVDEHVVVLVRELLRVQRLEAAVDLLLRRRQPDLVALERVVDRLRRGEELLRAGDDPPLGVEAGVPHQRHERVVDLRHAAAERGRGEVHEPLPAQRLGQPPDLLHQPTRGDGRVVRERLLSDVDELEHQRPPRIAIELGGAQSSRSLTNRRREPPPSRSPISTSSVSARMISIPRPPSSRSSSAPGCVGVRVEAAAGVADLDREPVGQQLVDDVDAAGTVLAVRVLDRVRTGLGQRELQIVQGLVRDRPHSGDRGQGQTTERDVLGLRRDGQANGASLIAHRLAPSRGESLLTSRILPRLPPKATGSDPSASPSARRDGAGGRRASGRARLRSERPDPG